MSNKNQCIIVQFEQQNLRVFSISNIKDLLSEVTNAVGELTPESKKMAGRMLDGDFGGFGFAGTYLKSLPMHGVKDGSITRVSLYLGEFAEVKS